MTQIPEKQSFRNIAESHTLKWRQEQSTEWLATLETEDITCAKKFTTNPFGICK